MLPRSQLVNCPMHVMLMCQLVLSNTNFLLTLELVTVKNRVCLVCAHEHMLSTKIHKFGVFLLVWLVNAGGSSLLKGCKLIKTKKNYQTLCLLCAHIHIIEKP